MKLPPYLFWWDWVEKIIWEPFGWLILFLIILWVPFLRVWWWFLLPVILAPQLKTVYLWWINWDFDYAKTKWVILEIIPPKEVLAPFKAMEDVFSTIWPVWDHPVFREKWCDGMLDYTPAWCSFEIASIEGKIHFYLRCLQQHKLMIETALYAHYPDLEIQETSDFTKLVPQTVPNEEWDMYGEDLVYDKDDALPIKTYEKFFEPQGERIAAEEKRIDPIISLLESLSRLGPGEYYWLQFILMPINPEKEDLWFKEGAQKIINKLAKRPEKKKGGLWTDIGYVLHHLVFGPKEEGSGESTKYSWRSYTKDDETGEREMVLTPGEREIITEVENKQKKPVFRTNIRGIYIAKRENWRSSHKAIARAYSAHFGAQNMNFLKYAAETRSKVHNFFRKRRVFLRSRKMFRMAVLRFTPAFPDRESFCPILGSEELATLFHFPLRVSGMVGPTMGKVESKKAGPPPNLPVE